MDGDLDATYVRDTGTFQRNDARKDLRTVCTPPQHIQQGPRPGTPQGRPAPRARTESTRTIWEEGPRARRIDSIEAATQLTRTETSYGYPQEVQQEGVKQGCQGDARAEERDAPQRPLRQESQKPQAGDRHRAFRGPPVRSAGSAAADEPQSQEEIARLPVPFTCAAGSAGAGEAGFTGAGKSYRIRAPW